MKAINSNQSAMIFENGYPVGNGHQGAMVWGAPEKEILSLNEDTLWSGTNYDLNQGTFTDRRKHALEKTRNLLKVRKNHLADIEVKKNLLGQWSQTYLPFARLEISSENPSPITDYKRQLNLSDAVVTSSYKQANTMVKKQTFGTYIDRVIVHKITSSSKQTISLKVSNQFEGSQVKINNKQFIVCGKAPIHQDPNYDLTANPSVYDDSIPSICFYGIIDCLPSDGIISNDKENLHIEDSTEMVIIISLATSYRGPFKKPGDIEVAKQRCINSLLKAKQKGYEQILADHLVDYHRLFEQIDFNVENKKVENLFDLGRYLLISSSRPGSQPANLQGVWNDLLFPPWGCNYTLNINAEMNYWLAEVCGLAECHMPLLEFTQELSISGKMAAQVLGCQGWTANHNSDLWRQPFAAKDQPNFAYWPMSSLWLCLHLFQHWEFTEDRNYLVQFAYPLMLSAARFCLDYMVVDETGKLVTSPSTSPENLFYNKLRHCQTAIGSTIDLTLVDQLFTNILSAEKILKTNHSIISEIKIAVKKIDPYKIGSKGQLLEYRQEYREVFISHRHLSHLIGLYPGDALINTNRLELTSACKKSLRRRSRYGKGWTGWSLAWNVGLYARLGEGDIALSYIEYILKNASYQNLLGKHKVSPNPLSHRSLFQIDSNFGITATICEMLIQSHGGVITLLPALPAKWQQGHIIGVRARGNIVVSIYWQRHKLDYAKIVKEVTGEICLKSKDQLLICNEGSLVKQVKKLDTISFMAEKDKVYIVKLA